MQPYQWLILLGLALFIAYRFLPVKGMKSITPEETEWKMQERDVQLVDVRTPQEFKTRRKNGFLNIPLNELKSRMQQLDKEKDVVLLCESGIRSSQAAKLLVKNGFTSVYNVKGGLAAWK